MSNRNRKIKKPEVQKSASKIHAYILTILVWAIVCIVSYIVTDTIKGGRESESTDNSGIVEELVQEAAPVPTVGNLYDKESDYVKWSCYEDKGQEVTSLMEMSNKNGISKYLIGFPDNTIWWLEIDSEGLRSWELFDDGVEIQEEESND